MSVVYCCCFAPLHGAAARLRTNYISKGMSETEGAWDMLKYAGEKSSRKIHRIRAMRRMSPNSLKNSNGMETDQSQSRCVRVPVRVCATRSHEWPHLSRHAHTHRQTLRWFYNMNFPSCLSPLSTTHLPTKVSSSFHHNDQPLGPPPRTTPAKESKSQRYNMSKAIL